MKRIFLLALLAISVPAARSFLSENVPDWAAGAAQQKVAMEPGVPATVLRDESDVVLRADGVAVSRHRLILRLLDNAGGQWAHEIAGYDSKTGRVRSNDAWIVRNGRVVVHKSGGDWLDASTEAAGTLYDESRMRTIDLRNETVANDTVLFESVIEEHLLVSQFIYSWGWKIPALEESYRVTVPAGFVVKAVVHGSQEPILEKSGDKLSWKWTLRDQPYNRDEPLSPALAAFEPIVLLQATPPVNLPHFNLPVFTDWRQLNQWQLGIAEGACDQSARITQDSVHLIKDSPDTLSKIRTLSKTVQSIRYVEVNSNLGRGDGYKPRNASEVYARGYGDCKDKTNLLRAMLREVGIKAYSALALVGDDSAVWTDFASPLQFNHVITAIEVDPSIQLPACIDWHGKHLLFFDPTDEFTQLGDLPAYVQGRNVDVLTPDSDGPISLPRISPATGFFESRKAELALGADGSIKGKVEILGKGQEGARLRAEFFHHAGPEDVKKHLSTLMSAHLRTSQFSENARSDDVITDTCRETFTLTQGHFIQPISAGLSLAHLDVFNVYAIHGLPSGQRHLPVKLSPIVQRDEVRLELPVNFTVAETPAPASLETEYGSFQSQIEIKDRHLIYQRTFEIRPQIVPAADYAKLRKFFADAARADKATLMLKTTASVAQNDKP